MFFGSVNFLIVIRLFLLFYAIMNLRQHFDQPRIAVIGAGALGRVVACMLGGTAHNVTLIGRDGSINALRREQETYGGLSFRAAGRDDSVVGAKNAADINIGLNLKTYDDLQKKQNFYDVLIYAAKAGYLSNVISQTQFLVRDDTKAVFMQGGIQWWCGYGFNDEMGLDHITDPFFVRHAFEMRQVYAALPNFGVDVVPGNPSFSRLKSNAPLMCGAVRPHEGSGDFLNKLSGSFNNGLVQPKISDDIFSTLWTKAAGSFAMSSFALITGKTLGQMVSDPDIFSRMVGAAEKIQAAGHLLGVKDNTDYVEYLREMGRKLKDHMMTITKDPSEHEVIIDMPIRIASKLGLDTNDLEEIAQQSRVAADQILAKIAKKPDPLRVAPN